MAASLNNPAWVEWMTTLMGGVSRQSYAATFPPDSFYCLLDELPMHLIPRRALRNVPVHQEPLLVNPEYTLCAAGDFPDELAALELSRFAVCGATVWVRNPATGFLLPFWLGPQLEDVVRKLEPQQPVPESVCETTRATLLAAGILIRENHAEQLRSKWQEKVVKAASLFRERGYAPIADLIHPFHIAALRRYYRHLIRTGAIQLGDAQSPRRYISYNDPVVRFFHRQIATTLSAVAEQPLKPSYVYLASYLSGAELKKHTDREQCEFSITFCLDFSPAPALGTPWPIRLETPMGTVSVYQAIGDALAYRGTRLPHYRGLLGEGLTSTSVFFHYVAADFAGSLD